MGRENNVKWIGGGTEIETETERSTDCEREMEEN